MSIEAPRKPDHAAHARKFSCIPDKLFVTLLIINYNWKIASPTTSSTHLRDQLRHQAQWQQRLEQRGHAHQRCRRTTFNASGDVGFYSGASNYCTINGVSRSINLSYTLDSFARGNSSAGPGMTVPAVTQHVPGQWIIRHCKDGNSAVINPPCIDGERVYIPAHDVVVPEHTIPAGMTSGTHGSSGDPFNIDFNGNPVFSGNAFDPKDANVVLSAVPEPATSALLLAALGVLGFMTRRKSGNGIAK